VYNGWHRVGSSAHLLHTEYGWTLLAKVALVLAAIGLGGYNKYAGLPAAARSARGLALVRAVLQLESILLLGALAAAAVLTSQQPPTA
jgi:putative copper resistance protein D